MTIPVHDRAGHLLGYVDADQLRDDAGKPIGERTLSDKATARLAKDAARRMTGGRQVLMDLGPSDVTTSTAARFAVGTPARPDYVADRVCPVRLVGHDRGSFYAETVNDAVQSVDPSQNAAGGDANEIHPGFVNTTFVTSAYALGAIIPRKLSSNADFDLERMTLRRLVNALRLAREQRVMTLLTTSGNWATGNRIAVGATAKWNGGSGSPNPLNDMMSAIAASYLPANVMVLPENVAPPFYVQPQASTGIRDYVQAEGEMPEVLYARAKVTLGGALSYLWSPYSGGTAGTGASNVAIVRVSPDPDEVSTAVTVRWNGQAPDGELVEGMLVRKYYRPQGDSDVLVVAHNDAEVFISNQVGALIVGATQ